MTRQTLEGEPRQKVLAAVWNALRVSRPDLFHLDKLNQPGGVIALDAHLDTLIEMSRTMTADRIEPYLARIIDDVCATCPQQDPSGYCPLRHVNDCVLFSHARLILETIDSVLRDLEDPEYLASHDRAGGA